MRYVGTITRAPPVRSGCEECGAPHIVKKRQRRLSRVDGMVLSLAEAAEALSAAGDELSTAASAHSRDEVATSQQEPVGGGPCPPRDRRSRRGTRARPPGFLGEGAELGAATSWPLLCGPSDRVEDCDGVQVVPPVRHSMQPFNHVFMRRVSSSVRRGRIRQWPVQFAAVLWQPPTPRLAGVTGKARCWGRSARRGQARCAC